MKLELVKNEAAYHEFMRLLRNDDRVQSGFVEKVSITPEQQESYMRRYGDNYYICLLDGEAAGYIGEIEGDIRLATHPDFQRQGVGKFMLREFAKRHPDCSAKVKIDNEASLKLFRSVGFRETFLHFAPPDPSELSS